jgi:hypothetical protein
LVHLDAGEVGLRQPLRLLGRKRRIVGDDVRVRRVLDLRFAVLYPFTVGRVRDQILLATVADEAVEPVVFVRPVLGHSPSISPSRMSVTN